MKRKLRLPVLATLPIDLSGRIALSLNEVAQTLGVSPRTVWEWHRRGILPGTKINQTLRFDTESVRSLFRPKTETI